jgi:heme/copper-type cytochrome/quinol oxidase subunit 2
VIYVFSFLLMLLGAMLNQAGVTIYTIYFWIIVTIIVLLMLVLELWAHQEDDKTKEEKE